MVINRLLSRFTSGKKQEYRLLMLGLDASGRTTFLYKLKLGEVVTTIPTIGFNVETIEWGRSENKQSSFLSISSSVVTFNLWDVGGCHRIRPLWRHYFQNTAGILFFIDSADRSRIQDARDELFRILKEEELKDAAICIIANKQDLVKNAMSASQIAEELDLQTFLSIDKNKSRRWVIKSVSSLKGTGMTETMDWLYNACIENDSEERKNRRNHDSKKEDEEADNDNNKNRSNLENTLIEWLEREDESDDDFLSKLDSYTLATWDHRTHLRIAWLLLSRHGRQKGLPVIFEKIQNFIHHSPRTARSRGTTFHVTMTYFWVHMVHYAMATTTMTMNQEQNGKYRINESDGEGIDSAGAENNFRNFLLLNPQLANGGLFLHYYSKKLMLQTSASRTEFVLPDLRPLPTLISDVVASSGNSVGKHSNHNDVSGNVSNSKKEPLLQKAAPLTDDEFLLRWESTTSASIKERHQKQQLTSWSGHESRIRIIWLCLQRYGRNKKCTEKIFNGMCSLEGSKYHNVTLTYFWLHMVDFYSQKILFLSLKKLSSSLMATKTENAGISFGLFIQKSTSQPLRNPDLVSKFYSQKHLENGKEEFVLPDLKSLPSIIST